MGGVFGKIKVCQSPHSVYYYSTGEALLFFKKLSCLCTFFPLCSFRSIIVLLLVITYIFTCAIFFLLQSFFANNYERLTKLDTVEENL